MQNTTGIIITELMSSMSHAIWSDSCEKSVRKCERGAVTRECETGVSNGVWGE